MKRTKVCPKCGSSNLFRFDGSAGAYGAGNNIPAGATIFSAVPVNRYVCMRCGYAEEWVDPEDLEKLKTSRKARGV